jgi:hypothetical protein
MMSCVDARAAQMTAAVLLSLSLACGSEAEGGGWGTESGRGGSVSSTGGDATGQGGSASGASGAGGAPRGGGATLAGAGGATVEGTTTGGNGFGGSGGVSNGSASGNAGSTGGGSGGFDPAWCKIGPVPEALRADWDIDPYYTQYADANGIPILTSSAPPATAIDLACRLVIEMVSQRDDVREALIANKTHFTVIGKNEKTNDVPEYSYLPDTINERARGLGGNPGMCAEESILCDASDRWRGESICVHEFAHTISLYGLYDADPTFESRLEQAYQAAKSAGRFADTYAMENEQEYWGEIVQDWYNTNLESEPPNGVHGPIDTREELKAYDPAAYDLVAELLSEDVSWQDCYRDD